MLKFLEVNPSHPLWPQAYRHLQATDCWRWVSKDDCLGDHMIILIAVVAEDVVGHISLKHQQLEMPTMPVSPVLYKNETVWETFVQTFYVIEAWRRKGVGKRLQEEAMVVSREKGCWQMRSWSSCDKGDNYQLKLALGFAFCPAKMEVNKEGQKIAGGYFVCRL